MDDYIRENLIDYADMRIKDINNYIDFNERRGEKDFFAIKELELFKIARNTLKIEEENNEQVFRRAFEELVQSLDIEVLEETVYIEKPDEEKHSNGTLYYVPHFPNARYISEAVHLSNELKKKECLEALKK